MEATGNVETVRYGQHLIGNVELSEPLRFLLAIFGPADTVLFRPIETWTEAGKKRSRVSFKHTKYRIAAPSLLLATMAQQLEDSSAEKTNVFFGVCPRFGDRGQYDLAWQIRTVNCLWADIDHCTVEEALQRCKDAGLPEPSLVVSSGKGCTSIGCWRSRISLRMLASRRRS